MKKVALALLVILTVAGYSFAGIYTPVIQPVDNGNSLVETYRIALQVDTSRTDLLLENGISSISNIAVTMGTGANGSLPVQLWWEGKSGNDPTIDQSDGYTEDLYSVGVGNLDTHILGKYMDETYGNGVQLTGDGFEEENNYSGLLDPDVVPIDDELLSGLGALGLVAGASNYAVEEPPAPGEEGFIDEMLFLQVVVPAGMNVTVSGGFTNDVRASAALGDLDFSFQVGGEIPEPGTIIMLVMGSLCLVGARLRRK